MKNVEWQLRVKGEVAVTPQDVIRATARYFRIQVEVIREKDAHKFVNRARQIAVWICHEKFPEMSYPDLGVVFNRDHTTIMSSVRKMGAEIEFKKDEKLKVQIAAIVEMVW
jgi:chromosomal replication initiator protein